MGALPDSVRQLLAPDPDLGVLDALDLLASELVGDIARMVPSCAVLSLRLPGLEGEIAVVVGAGGVPAPIAASVAVPLAGGYGGAVLILRATAAGAFLLLAADLDRGQRPGRAAAVLDQHLDFDAAANAQRVTAALDDQHWVSIGIGILIDRHRLTVEAADGELQRNAGEAVVSQATAARRLAASCSGRDAVGDHR